MAVKCKVIKDFGTISKQGNQELKLQYISWNGNEPKYDLRVWRNGYSVRGVVFDKEELNDLKGILKRIKFTPEEKKVETPVKKTTPVKENAPAKSNIVSMYCNTQKNDVVKTLCSLPVNDSNYLTALKNATKENLGVAITLMKADKNGKHKTRIMRCEMQLKSLNKNGKSKTEKVTNTEVKAQPQKKAEIIQFPKKERSPIKKLPHVDETHTYEECKAKFDEERKLFKDIISQYVFDALLEVCQSDEDFRNNVMREEKTYTKAIQYLFKEAKNGYCIRTGDVGTLNGDDGIKVIIDYYNMKEEEEKYDEKAKGKSDEKVHGKVKSNK